MVSCSLHFDHLWVCGGVSLLKNPLMKCGRHAYLGVEVFRMQLEIILI